MGTDMLTKPHRLVSGPRFAEAVRQGRSAGSPSLVLHLAAATGDATVPAQVGFVVGRGVGPAVARNRVKRRLRHLARSRLSSLPTNSALVVRALPDAAGASYPRLSGDFDRALARLRSETTR